MLIEPSARQWGHSRSKIYLCEGVGGRGDISQSQSRFVVRFPVGIFCSVALFCSWRSSHLLGDMKGNLLLGYVWWQLNGIGQVGGTFMCKPSLQIGISFFTLPDAKCAISKNCHPPGLTLCKYRYFGLRPN